MVNPPFANPIREKLYNLGAEEGDSVLLKASDCSDCDELASLVAKNPEATRLILGDYRRNFHKGITLKSILYNILDLGDYYRDDEFLHGIVKALYQEEVIESAAILGKRDSEILLAGLSDVYMESKDPEIIRKIASIASEYNGRNLASLINAFVGLVNCSQSEDSDDEGKCDAVDYLISIAKKQSEETKSILDVLSYLALVFRDENRIKRVAEDYLNEGSLWASYLKKLKKFPAVEREIFSGKEQGES